MSSVAELMRQQLDLQLERIHSLHAEIVEKEDAFKKVTAEHRNTEKMLLSVSPLFATCQNGIRQYLVDWSDSANTLESIGADLETLHKKMEAAQESVKRRAEAFDAVKDSKKKDIRALMKQKVRSELATKERECMVHYEELQVRLQAMERAKKELMDARVQFTLTKAATLVLECDDVDSLEKARTDVASWTKIHAHLEHSTAVAQEQVDQTNSELVELEARLRAFSTVALPAFIGDTQVEEQITEKVAEEETDAEEDPEEDTEENLEEDSEEDLEEGASPEEEDKEKMSAAGKDSVDLD